MKNRTNVLCYTLNTNLLFKRSHNFKTKNRTSKALAKTQLYRECVVEPKEGKKNLCVIF